MTKSRVRKYWGSIFWFTNFTVSRALASLCRFLRYPSFIFFLRWLESDRKLGAVTIHTHTHTPQADAFDHSILRWAKVYTTGSTKKSGQTVSFFKNGSLKLPSPIVQWQVVELWAMDVKDRQERNEKKWWVKVIPIRCMGFCANRYGTNENECTFKANFRDWQRQTCEAMCAKGNNIPLMRFDLAYLAYWW